MSRYQPTPDVVRATMFAAVPPFALLVLLASTVIAPGLEPAAMTAAAIGVAAWGARTGVLASGRRGGVWWRGLLQSGRVAGVVAIAVAVRVVSLGAPASAIERSTVVPAILLLFVLLAAGAFGRIHRRQADPLTTAAAHRAADAALAVVLVTGAATVIAFTTLAWTMDSVGLPARWFPLGWLLATVAVLVAARPTMLRARTATTATSSGGGWGTALLPIAGVMVAVVALITLVLAAGAEQRLRDTLPALPALQLDLLDGVSDTGASPARRPTAGGGGRWQLAALAGIAVLLLTLGPVARRRRRGLRPVGPGMSLLMFLRSLLGAGRPSRVVTDDETALEDPSPDSRAGRLDRAPPAWMERFRPRPREPAAAILYDYRLVQRRLPDGRRRRPSETVLAHAVREDIGALSELADLVCAIRYAGRRPTTTDADRSRQLTRTLRHDR